MKAGDVTGVSSAMRLLMKSIFQVRRRKRILYLCVCMREKGGQGSEMHMTLTKHHETKMKNHTDLYSVCVCVCLLTPGTQNERQTILHNDKT